jgi:hypothetical protein
MNHVSRTVSGTTVLAAALSMGAAFADDTGSAAGAATFNARDELLQPEGFRAWVLIGAPLTPHGLNNGKAGFPEYHHVYVDPDALPSSTRCCASRSAARRETVVGSPNRAWSPETLPARGPRLSGRGPASESSHWVCRVRMRGRPRRSISSGSAAMGGG